MNDVFVESTVFEKYRKEYLDDEEYRLFQIELMSNLKQGNVIQGTGGLKIRVAIGGNKRNATKGKRSGARVIYYVLEHKQLCYLLTIYSKNEISDLTTEQKKQLTHFVEEWRNE